MWLYWRWIGPYAGIPYHETSKLKYEKYGPVVKEAVAFNISIFHLFDQRDILAVLNANSEFPLRPPNEADVYYRLSRPDIYSDLGMVNENGPKWKHLRKQFTPPLTRRKTLSNYSSMMNNIGEDFVELVLQNRSAESGIVKNIRQLVYRAGLETVCAVALERRMGFLLKELDSQAVLIFDAINGYQSASNEAMYGLPWWKLVPKSFSSVFTNLVRNKDALHEIIGAIVDDTLRSEEFIKSEDNESQSILDQLLSNQSIRLSEVKTCVIDYITAGVDTIGNTVMFAVALIASHAKVRAKLQVELDSVQDGNFNPETIEQCRYLKACVMESFRMYPTASQIARILEEDTLVSDDYVLPKHSVVLCHQRLASLQECNFTRAAEFIPERWLDDKRDASWNHNVGLVVPFGVGRRICPGKRLAEQELHILIAKLFRRHDLVLLGQLDADFNFLLVPSDNFQLQVLDRM